MTDAPATDAFDACNSPSAGSNGGTLRRDIASAYLVIATRLGAWAVISALVFRVLGRNAFAMLALIRSTVGLLAYTSLGLAPAMVRALAVAGRSGEPADAVSALPDSASGQIWLPGQPWKKVYASGEVLAQLAAGIGVLLTVLYAVASPYLHNVPTVLRTDTAEAAFLFGLGMVARLLGEPPSSVLQVRGRLSLDNMLLAICELVWVGASLIIVSHAGSIAGVGFAFLLGNLLLLCGRLAALRSMPGTHGIPNLHPDWIIIRQLLVFGVGVAIAQAADFLYAPTDYILINRLIGPDTVAIYAPAAQLDSGLLLIVTGLAAVILPHSAVAHAAGDRAAVRRYFVRGTLASTAVLVLAATAAWLAAPFLLRLWLGAPMPETVAILPIVLLGTVVGGSAAVGRSVLLAMGRVKAFTISVVLAGVANVLFSYIFVRFFNLGLTGIILGTIVAVIARCAIWMPWYLLRSLKQADERTCRF